MCHRSIPSLWLDLALLTVLSSRTDAPAQALRMDRAENLDLPAEPSETARSQEEPLDIVEFYDQTLEGDAFVYVIDRSGTMQDRGELTRAKAEVSHNVAAFSPRTRFAIIFFDSGIARYPRRGNPLEATPGNRREALHWIARIGGGSSTCPTPALLEALELALAAPARRRIVAYVGDGGGTCSCEDEAEYLDEMLDTVTKENAGRVPIHCVGVLMEGRSMQKKYLRRLARRNRGTYSEID